MKRTLHKNAAVRRSAYGLGLFAVGPIKKHDVVAEYWGKIVTEEELIRCNGKYFFQLDNGMAIDGKSRKNVARYINHSCAPNCEPQEDEKQRVFITAKRDIKAGEEFGYEYGKEYWDEYIRPIGCRCGCGGKGPKRWRKALHAPGAKPGQIVADAECLNVRLARPSRGASPCRNSPNGRAQ